MGKIKTAGDDIRSSPCRLCDTSEKRRDAPGVGSKNTSDEEQHPGVGLLCVTSRRGDGENTKESEMNSAAYWQFPNLKERHI